VVHWFQEPVQAARPLLRHTKAISVVLSGAHRCAKRTNRQIHRPRYAIPVSSGFMSAELKGQVNSFLKRAFKCGFCSKLYSVEAIAYDADVDLFCKMANLRHYVHSLLPPIKSCNHHLRPKG